MIAVTVGELGTGDSTWAVPSFDVVACGMRRADYALCVFVLNEGERISPPVLYKIEKRASTP